jgi:hypothetical protein
MKEGEYPKNDTLYKEIYRREFPEMKNILIFPFFILCLQAKYITSQDISLMSQCDVMHIGRLGNVSVYIDGWSEKFVCYEGELIVDTTGNTICYTGSDSLCKRILASYYHQQDEILPCIIEKIKDTASISYCGDMKYTLSDVAIRVITEILEKNYGFCVVSFCEREFDESCGMYHNLPDAMVFKGNYPEENYRRRILYYNTVKEIYERGRIQKK